MTTITIDECHYNSTTQCTRLSSTLRIHYFLTIGKGCWALSAGSVLGWLLMSAAAAAAAATTAPDMSKERFHLLGGGVRAELEEPEVGHGEFSRVGGRLPGRLWAGGGLTCTRSNNGRLFEGS